MAGLFSLFSGFYFPFWTAIDNFTPFAVAGALALVCAWKGGDGTDGTKGTKGTEGRRKQKSGIREQGVWFVLGGVFAGLAHLARADGPLLLAVIILVYMLRSSEFGVRSSGFRDYILRTTHYGLRFTLPLLLGYLLIMTPWFIRNWQVAGALLPASGSQTIWLVDYDDLFSYRQEISPQRFWAQGMGPILQGRWWVFTVNLQTVLAVWGMIFLAPLAVIGGWHRRDHSLVQLSGGYALLLFLAMTLLFAFPGARGGLFHSGAALLPFICALAGVGLDRGVDWVAARRRGWQPKTAKRVFGVGLLVMAMGLSSFIYYQRVIRNNAWNRADALYPAIASWVDEQKPDAVVMIGNPPAYRYHGGGLSVIVPDGDMATILEVARHYGVDYLILDPNHPEPLNPLYQNPSLNPALHLVQTYGAGSGGEVYIFEIKD